MRITGWHVDGYGRFHDRGWDALPAGLTVLHGPNEAGKSTLLSFLRSMLFGLRDGRSSTPAIPALAGGRHGGVLRVADEDDAAWTIERHGRTLGVLDGAGEAHDQRALDRLLGGVGREVFEAVFAFGLRELEALGGLDDEALRDQLFAASLTGGGSSAHDAVAALDARVERLWRPRGDAPLRDLDRRLKELRAERRTALDAQDRYASLRDRETAAEEAIAALDDRSRRVRREHERLARLTRVWGLVDPLDRRRAELRALAAGPTVAADEVTAARDADREAQAAAERRDEVRARRGSTASALEAIDVEPRLLAAADALAVLDREVVAQRDRLLARSGRHDVATRLRDEARAATHDLGHGWTVAAATAVDASLPVRRAAARHADAVRSAAGEVETATAREAEAQARAGACAERVREAGRRVQEARESEDDPPTPDALDRAASVLAELRGALQDLQARRAALRTATSVLDGLRAETARPVPEPATAPGRPTVPLLLVVGVLSVALGLGVLALGQPLGGGALVLIGVAVVAVHRAGGAGAAADDVARRARAADAEARATEHAGRVRRAEEDDRVAREAVAALERRIVEIAPVADLAPDGLLEDASTAPVERRVAEVHRLRERRRRLDDELAALRSAEDAAREAARVAARTAVEVEGARVAHDAADAARRSWAAERGLPLDLPADDVPPLLAALERAQDAVRAADDAAAATDAADHALDAWTARAVAVLQDAGRLGGIATGPAARATVADGPVARPDGRARDRGHADAQPDPSGEQPVPASVHDAVLLAVTDAHAAARAARDGAGRRAVLVERDDVDRAEEERLTARIAARIADRDAVLASHGCADVAALTDACDRTTRRATLTATVREGEAAVRAEAGAGADADLLIDEARTGDVGAWAARRDELEAELARLDEDRADAIAGRTDAARDREALERSVDLARIDGEIEETRAEAARLLAELRTVLRARELVTSTLDAFVRDRQPTVLRDASAWFARITDGRYDTVRQTVQERRGRQVAVLQVVSPDGRTHDPVTLSRGTREQLYLALRLALVGRTAREATPLPLVMDDVLVNVSPDRARVAARVIAEVAREHQVLYFTCHPSTRDLLVQAAGTDAVGVEELARA